jgi:uncharacterized membrane protein required for colicin V production
MSWNTLNVSWVDFLVLGLLGFGFWRGRKRGMSEELIDIIKWVITVVVAGLLHQPIAQLLSQWTPALSTLVCSVSTYLFLVLLVAIAFSYIHSGPGKKLAGSDTFGSAEYYLGMLSGTFRYACILIVAFSFLNARQYSAAELKASEQYQLDNFGSSFFITLPDLQREVFTRSLTGRCVREYLGFVLIQPAASGVRQPAGANNNARARERSNF